MGITPIHQKMDRGDTTACRFVYNACDNHTGQRSVMSMPCIQTNASKKNGTFLSYHRNVPFLFIFYNYIANLISVS